MNLPFTSAMASPLEMAGVELMPPCLQPVIKAELTINSGIIFFMYLFLMLWFQWKNRLQYLMREFHFSSDRQVLDR